MRLLSLPVGFFSPKLHSWTTVLSSFMTQRTSPEPGRYLWWDLKLYRERQELSLEYLHERLRIAPQVLAEFEEAGLVGHPVYNPVYVRALLRAYAQEVGLPPDEVVHLYDLSVQGKYRGALARKYLGVELPEVPEEEGNMLSEQVSALPPPRSPLKPSARAVPAAEKKKGIFQPLSFVVLILVLAAVAVIIWFWVRSAGEDSRPPSSHEAPVRLQDTLRLQRIQPEVTRPAARLEVGDSLDVWVVARYGKLEPVQVQIDTGRVWFRPLNKPAAVYVLRPYTWTPLWIEAGDTLRIWARHQIRLRQFLQRAYIEVEGHPWPRKPGEREIVLTRERVQAFLDSLSQYM